MTTPATLGSMESTCACGAPPTANGRECGDCYRSRLGSVSVGFAPTRSLGAGQVDTQASRRFENRLHDYAAVRHEGIQPRGTKRRDIDEAKAISDTAGAAFRADPYARTSAPTT